MGRKSSLPMTVLFFVVSFTLSGIGVYFWANQSQQIEIESTDNYQSGIVEIESKYNSKIDSIQDIPINTSHIDEQISYWKSRRPANIEERQMIRENIADLSDERANVIDGINERRNESISRLKQQKQSEIELLSVRLTNKNREAGRNNFVTIILFLMVVVTEFLIVSIQKQISTYYDKYQMDTIRMIREYEIRGTNMHDEKAINKLKYHPLIVKHFENESPEESFKKIKDTYNLLFELNLVDKKGKLKPDSSKQLKEFYSKINVL